MTTTTRNQDGKVRKKVRFSSPNEFHQDEAEPPSPTEKAAIWYSGAEIMTMKKQIFVAVHFKDTKKAIPNYNWRGLEQYATGTSKQHLARRREFVSEFLSLQHELLQSDVEEQEDPLALFAADQTRHDRKVAAKLAKQDELDARKVYKASKMLKWRRSEKDTIMSSSKSFAFMASLVQGFRPGSMQFKIATSA